MAASESSEGSGCSGKSGEWHGDSHQQNGLHLVQPCDTTKNL